MAKGQKQASSAEKKPWEQDSSQDGLALPGEEFDYDDFVKREFGGKPHEAIGIRRRWWITALVLVVALAVLILMGLF